MKSFVYKIVKISILSLIILQVFGLFLEQVFSKDKSNKIIWMQNIDDDEFDYAFLGSSRTLNMIDINFIDSTCDLKGVNLGLGGVDYRTLYMILFSFIEVQNNKVSKVYIQVDPMMFYRDSIYNKPEYNHYFYSLTEYSEIQKCFENKEKVLLYYYFPILKYIEYNKVYNLTNFFRSLSNTSKYDVTLGSAIINIHMPFKPESISNTAKETTILSGEDVDFLEEILNFNYNNNIQSVLYMAPIYNYKDLLEPFYPNYNVYINSFSKRHKVDYVNFSTLLTDSVDMFADKIHTNIKGTHAFSKTLTNKVFDCTN